MTVLILHLSDIHIQEKSDPVLTRAAIIAKPLNPYLPDASLVVVVLSGDIAQAGKEAEYELAHGLIRQIVEHIRAECTAPIKVIIAPGNHDCDFRGDQEARQTILGAVAKKVGNVPDSYITTGVAVQGNFFAFQKVYAADINVRFEDALWQCFEFEVDGKSVIFDVLNASWMSSRYEQQGGLLFPFERYTTQKQEDSDLRISILHHPFNWYNQSNYLKFRAFIHHLADVVFTGHEHESTGRMSDDAHSGECAYVEGAALQLRDKPQHSGLNVVVVDLENRRFRYIPHSLQDGQYRPTATNAEWQEFRSLPKRKAGRLQLTSGFRETLKDPGATLKHPSGLAVTLDDIFVFPDLDVRLDKRSEKIRGKNVAKLSSRTLLRPDALDKDILIEGGEVSGKTRLLYRLFDEYHQQGYFPLLIRGKELKRSSAPEVVKHLDRALEQQYGAENAITFAQESKARKILLLDDLDGSPVRGQAKAAMLRVLQKDFHRTVATVSENYELAELFDADDAVGLNEFTHYQISPLGYERRGELVRRWTAIGRDETLTANDALKLVDDAEKLIESARLQHVASTVPIYVLSLLQATASGLSKELHNSSFAHYYYFLIVGALEKGGVRQSEMAPYIAACTHLSWFIKVNGEEQGISLSDFARFVHQYSRDWTETDANQLLNVLTTSKLVEIDGNALCFTYPYAYYYFLGRFASISLSDEKVLDYLRYCVNHLYVRECANTLLFLAHHTANSVVLDHVITALAEHLKHRRPVSLDKSDVQSVAALIAYAPSLKYRAQKPEEYRRTVAKSRDANENGDQLAEKPAQRRELFHEMLSLMKAIEIAGALLTHQFSNYPRKKKVDAVREIFDSALRGIRELYSYFDQDTDQLVAALSLRMKASSSMTAERAEQQTRLAIGMLLRGIAAGFINKAGVHLTAKELAANVEEAVTGNPTCAYRLIRISQQLQQPGRLPRLEISRLIREEEDNPCVMGALQVLVLQRLYMYEADHDDKDWAISVFKLAGASNAIEVRHKKDYLRMSGSGKTS